MLTGLWIEVAKRILGQLERGASRRLFGGEPISKKSITYNILAQPDARNRSAPSGYFATFKKDNESCFV